MGYKIKGKCRFQRERVFNTKPMLKTAVGEQLLGALSSITVSVQVSTTAREKT